MPPIWSYKDKVWGILSGDLSENNRVMSKTADYSIMVINLAKMSEIESSLKKILQ